MATSVTNVRVSSETLCLDIERLFRDSDYPYTFNMPIKREHFKTLVNRPTLRESMRLIKTLPSVKQVLFTLFVKERKLEVMLVDKIMDLLWPYAMTDDWFSCAQISQNYHFSQNDIKYIREFTERNREMDSFIKTMAEFSGIVEPEGLLGSDDQGEYVAPGPTNPSRSLDSRRPEPRPNPSRTAGKKRTKNVTTTQNWCRKVPRTETITQPTEPAQTTEQTSAHKEAMENLVKTYTETVQNMEIATLQDPQRPGVLEDSSDESSDSDGEGGLPLGDGEDDPLLKDF